MYKPYYLKSLCYKYLFWLIRFKLHMYVDTKKADYSQTTNFSELLVFLVGDGQGGLTVVFGHMNTH